jgi:hypothetical protein
MSEFLFLFLSSLQVLNNYMLECCCFFNIRHALYILELLNMLELLLLNFCTCYMSSEFASDVFCFFNIKPAMVNKKHLEVAKK